MKYFKIICTGVLLLSASIQLSCKKQLDKKPDQQLVTIDKLKDVRALLEYQPHMVGDPAADEASADNYYLPDAVLAAISDPSFQNMYRWEKDHFFDAGFNDWTIVYRKVFYCNTSLEALETIGVTEGNSAEWKELRGQALFKRGRSFFQVACIWSKGYNAATAATDPGIPLRLQSDFNEVSVRSTLGETYQRVLSDLKEASYLLPVNVVNASRPSKTAAYAMLSRVYLSMRDYPHAKLYADSSLSLNGNLIDYNTINANPPFPFMQLNTETLFYGTMSNSLTFQGTAVVDSTLYSMYDSNDLRKNLFFRSNGGGRYLFRGSYTGGGLYFSGLANDEVYLTRAECYARAGNVAAAMADLNTLLSKRFRSSRFVAVTAPGPVDALRKILVERRKELPMRSIRWMDIKRLNLEDAGITLRRFINGQLITLAPNSPRFALPIPEEVISITGMTQNPR